MLLNFRTNPANCNGYFCTNPNYLCYAFLHEKTLSWVMYSENN